MFIFILALGLRVIQQSDVALRDFCDLWLTVSFHADCKLDRTTLLTIPR